jgi:hypothetical protein
MADPKESLQNPFDQAQNFRATLVRLLHDSSPTNDVDNKDITSCDTSTISVISVATPTPASSTPPSVLNNKVAVTRQIATAIIGHNPEDWRNGNLILWAVSSAFISLNNRA